MMSDSEILPPAADHAQLEPDMMDSGGFGSQADNTPLPQPPPADTDHFRESESGANIASEQTRRTSDPPTSASATANQTASLSTGPLPDYSTLAIVDALKSSDNTGQTFIVYLVRCGSSDAKRRYSEFEALREALVRLFPCYIVPPIPGKHTFGDYATKPSTAKEDGNIIARRRRMLGSFLHRCAGHNVLNRSIVFQRFLDGRFSWHDITMSPPLSLLPKSNLRGPASDPTSTPSPTSLAAYATAPLPAANAQPREPNKRFLDSEAFTDRFAQHLAGSVDKANRRLVKRWTELSADFAELGAVLNGFSLTESGSLAPAIERVGQAADTSYLGAGQLMQEWEQAFTEPMQEYVQFAAILQKGLRWRTAKHVQYELALDTLEIKRAQLDEYERIEREALRFDAALARGGRGIVERSTYATGGGGGSSAAARTLDEDHAQWRTGTGSNAATSGTMRRSLYGAAAEDEVDPPTRDSPSSPRMSNTQSMSAELGGGRANRPEIPDFEPTAPGAVDLVRSASLATVRSGGSSTRVPGQARHRGAGNTTGPGGGGSGGILGALTHTFASMMDTNPAGTRLANVAKLRATVILLEEAVELLRADLDFATQTIQADLDRFQRQKVVDLKEMMISFAKMHREMCRQNLESWQAAKAEISRIDTDSAMPNSSLTKKEREEEDRGSVPSPPSAQLALSSGGFSSAGLEEEGGF
ncbi:hypothetical protein A4X09_0g4913 [Tilletia walkeri]|uniref:PX domain-containing protein n=1 Tax=Tilletia walkeri TaxID=117179 RepID=A0A8X7N877_9BASI|nr:hypothetical protein A4X09_0g4913 [Tilletia walkeri]